ncbi:MarR family winged helix-turn-helix transcriptional regulator [Herbiconiux sp. CPCC 203407]|uniref:MarR family winged helix-turn-helix transcriptional regulator n=1 Tax=Herbiconiux oxytropis TaxID=2970915 RepID=A0AA41XJH0_9MICO|nr:MarR family winged helix-turn-helix transcriptional regulator [Herbiconiux oxytropis]MCS5724210.1 MarR family winged helix-turn-helix transcriptional regulator [Herbiconiux oxytropis]MCS5727315.1 MarR family winged helix-turn-helix transcriptional regulator [Herbiconiux oxytropis]
MTTPPIAPFADSPAVKLHRATALLDRISDRYLRAHHGIPYSDFVVLLVVRVLGEPTQREIADDLSVSRASVTQRLEGLRANGLVEVRPHPRDARARLVRLTSEGGALLDRAWRGLDGRQDGVDAGVDLELLGGLLDRVIANALGVLAAGAGDQA